MHNSCFTKRKDCETGFKKNITIFRRNSTSKLCETEAANCLNHYLNCLWCLYQGITVQAPLGVGKVHFSDLKWTRVRSHLAQLKWKQTKHKSNCIFSVDHEHQDAFFCPSKELLLSAVSVGGTFPVHWRQNIIIILWVRWDLGRCISTPVEL